MLILNFSHPLTPEHLAHIETLAEQSVEQVIEVHSQIVAGHALRPQVTAMATGAGLTPDQWQNEPSSA